VGAVNKYLKTRHSDSDAAVAAASTGSSIQLDDEDVVQMEIDEEDQSIEAGPVEDLRGGRSPLCKSAAYFEAERRERLLGIKLMVLSTVRQQKVTLDNMPGIEDMPNDDETLMHIRGTSLSFLLLSPFSLRNQPTKI
jgi:hypothetical protein